MQFYYFLNKKQGTEVKNHHKIIKFDKEFVLRAFYVKKQLY